MTSVRPHLMVRPEDELLILVPNTPVKVNRTALRILVAMVDRGETIVDVLAREGDGPRRRAEIHAFFADLSAWLSGTLGEGRGRRAVIHEPFTAEFCRYPVLAEVALTYRCNLSCRFCYADRYDIRACADHRAVPAEASPESKCPPEHVIICCAGDHLCQIGGNGEHGCRERDVVDECAHDC